ncbi:MAG: MFS transporter, partial [Muribaculaceae bacterium]|nr:MFS transporter [Muribaculaceae bacterium]
MFPACQNMFIKLATTAPRGTANSTLLVSWDIGVGLGVLLGGVLAEHWGFHSAFWGAWIANLIGVAFFFLYVRSHFLRNRLR